MNSIYFKNFIITAMMVLLSFLILGTAFVFLGRSFIVNEKRRNLTTNADEIAQYAAVYYVVDDLSNLELRMIITSISHITGNDIFICDAEGVIVSCSDRELLSPNIGRQLPAEVMNILRAYGGMDQLTNLAGFFPSTHYVVAEAVSDDRGGAAVGFVFVSSESASIVDAWDTFLLVYLFVAVAILLLAMTMAYFTSKRQAKPINEMAEAAHKFAHGDFSVRIEEDPEREDEIGELTRAFNAMADSLEKSDRLSREFIANVSHELKTPMTTISGFADGILDGTVPPENQKKYLEIISQETKRLSRLVRRMLELSRLQSGGGAELKRKTFDINEILMRTLLNFEGRITAKNLGVDAQIPEEPVRVRGDGDAVTQVVYNLLDNAVKFAPPGSGIAVGLWKEEGRAFVSVKNSGDTIPAAELAQIFDRFHKTDRSRGLDRDGVGLGLYIVKTILNNHDEDVFVTSRDGLTEFVFTLTLA